VVKIFGALALKELIQRRSIFESLQKRENMNTTIDLYRRAEDYFFRGIASKCLDLGNKANAYMTASAGLNFIYIKKTDDLEDTLINGKEFFAIDKYAFDVFIPQELCTPQIETILNKLGYSNIDSSVAMMLCLDSALVYTNLSPDGEITILSNDNQLSEWMRPLIGAFESTFEVCLNYAKLHENALKKNINLRHFSLYKLGEPIATITLSLINDVARIDDLGTLPEFQGKGYASILMRYVLLEAKKLGARYCFLESSASGLKVYQKLGFESLFENNIYSRKS